MIKHPFRKDPCGKRLIFRINIFLKTTFSSYKNKTVPNSLGEDSFIGYNVRQDFAGRFWGDTLSEKTRSENQISFEESSNVWKTRNYLTLNKNVYGNIIEPF